MIIYNHIYEIYNNQIHFTKILKFQFDISLVGAFGLILNVDIALEI